MARIRHPKDFFAGLLFIAFGVAAIGIALDYPLGSAARMGPGYFPRILGILLMTLGTFLSLRSLWLTGPGLSTWHWKPFLIVLGSVLVFGLTAQSLGLVIATLLLVVLSGFASDEFRIVEGLISAAIQAVFVIGVFVYGLGVQFPVWPSFLGGN